MQFELDPTNRTAKITGLTPESIGAVPFALYNDVISRLSTLEQKLSPATYDLTVNTANGLKTIISISNSLVGTVSDGYDLPGTFRLASIVAGKETAWSPLTSNGTSLEQRWAEGNGSNTPRGMLERGGLTHLVLQELSNRPLLNPELFTQYANQFIDLCRQYSPNCLIYLFENWSYVDSSNWQADFTAMDNVYQAIAAAKGVGIIPFGRAWNILRMQPGFNTLNPYYDNRHPTLIGVYLNAMVALGRILNVNPISNSFIPTSGISTQQALRLRDIASKSLIQDALNSFNEYTFTSVSIKEGAVIRDVNYRTTTLEIYAKSINWNNGANQVTTVNGYGSLNSSMGYPTVNGNATLLYQDSTSPIELNGTQQSPQLITGLDPTKPIYIAVNDSNYANNSGSLIIGYR